VINRALTVYEAVMSEIAEGNEIVIRKPDGSTTKWEIR
jgi:hypothetical protein